MNLTVLKHPHVLEKLMFYNPVIVKLGDEQYSTLCVRIRNSTVLYV